MKEEWWETPTCWICDYWWAFLLAIVLALAAYFSKDYWLPYLIPEPPALPTLEITLPPAPAETSTPAPSLTDTPVSLATSVPTPVPTDTEVVLGTGDIQVTLRWEGLNDLDLYVTGPNGELIYYNHPTSADGGQLDIDSNRGCGGNITSQPVENIFWPSGEAPLGQYVIYVHYFKYCDDEPLATPFTVSLLVDGALQEFAGIAEAVNQKIDIITLER